MHDGPFGRPAPLRLDAAGGAVRPSLDALARELADLRARVAAMQAAADRRAAAETAAKNGLAEYLRQYAEAVRRCTDEAKRAQARPVFAA